jgi:hypothetical protein
MEAAVLFRVMLGAGCDFLKAVMPVGRMTPIHYDPSGFFLPRQRAESVRYCLISIELQSTIFLYDGLSRHRQKQLPTESHGKGQRSAREMIR